MLAGAQGSRMFATQVDTLPLSRPYSQAKIVPVAPAMSAKRLNLAIVTRLCKTTAPKQARLAKQWTGLQMHSHALHSMSPAQPATQTTVQKLSQWWEHQWNQQQKSQHQHSQQRQQPQPQQQHHHVQQQLHKQQQQWQQQHNGMHQQPPPPGNALPFPQTRESRPRRRKGRPNIVSSASAPAATTNYGSPASLQATARFKSLLATGNRYRKMSNAAELLAQAQCLHKLQLPASADFLQASTQAFSSQQLHQRQHDLPESALRQQQSQGNSGPTQALKQAPGGAAGQDQRHDSDQDRNAAAEREMASVALDVVESQLPQWTNRKSLDWSAQQDLSVYKPQMQLKSTPTGGLPILTKFTIEERGESVEVQPLWVVVHQETPDGVARLYETVHTLYPEVLDHIAATVEPFCITDRNTMTFSKPQFSHGSWKGYLVGAVGDVAAKEEDALWPNRLFCEKRVMHNVRHGWDIAKFLAEPKVEDMAGHHANLKLLQEDRQYQAGWVWRMLSSRWGEDAVAAYANTVRQMEHQASHHALRASAQCVPTRQLQYA